MGFVSTVSILPRLRRLLVDFALSPASAATAAALARGEAPSSRDAAKKTLILLMQLVHTCQVPPEARACASRMREIEVKTLFFEGDFSGLVAPSSPTEAVSQKAISAKESFKLQVFFQAFELTSRN